MELLQQKKGYKRFIQHLSFWIFILFFTVLRTKMSFAGYSFEIFLSSLIEEAIHLPVMICASYFTIYFLFPKYFYKRKYIVFAVLFFISILAFVLLLRVISYYISYPLLYPQYKDFSPNFISFNLLQHAFYIYTSVSIVVIIKLAKYWYSTFQLKLKLEQQNKTSELALLKSQLSPHFLFNTLNNINSLVNKNPSKTSASIIKLSDIMRYMVYETNKEKVPLVKEIDYLYNYIGLQQLRLENLEFVHFSIEGNYSKKNIAPMLFISFVENAFKHGEKNVQSPGITINLQIFDSYLRFEVCNYLKKIKKPQITNDSGIGFSNVKRRLELIYGNNYKLNITTTDNKYKVELEIYET
ncbi:MAG: histidine kinase [Salinivirgaceae bacterium]|nr:histidine kinase [Salinivirgaceae bacterium]